MSSRKRPQFALAALLASLALGSNSLAAEPVKFSIPAGDAAQTLKTFGAQAKLQMLFLTEAVEKHATAEINGQLEPKEALKQLLSGTGLTFEFVNERTVTVKKAGKAQVSALNVATADSASTMRQTPGESVPAEDDITRSDRTAGARNQGTNETPPAEPESDASTVTVTGSRIRGVSPTTRTIVIDRADFERGGFVTTEDVLRSLTFNRNTQGSQQRSSISRGEFNSTGWTGLASADLRGLGSGATLILMNGRRLPSSPLTAIGTQLTDISSIPLAAVERVEVVLDGASSIYGSDAVGGVINFILRKNYSGGEAKARYTNSSTGADGYVAELTHGFTWDGGNMLVTLSAGKEDPVEASELISTMDFRSRGGRDLRPIGIGPTGTFFLEDPSRAAELGLPAGTAAVTFPAGVTPSLANAITSTDPDGADLPRLDYDRESQLLGSTRNQSFSLAGEQTLGGKVTLQGDFTYARRDAETAASSYSFDRNFDAYVPAPGTLLAPLDPATDPFPLFVNYSGLNDVRAGSGAARSLDRNDNRRYQANAGLNVDLWSGWKSTLNFTYGKEKQASHGRGYNFSTIPQGFDPFSDGSDQDPAVIDTLFDESTNNIWSDTRGLTLAGDGGVGHIPGGAVRLSTGVEVRKERFGSTDENSDFGGSRTLKAAYAEFYVPLVGKANAMRGLQSLTASAAGRYETYDQEAVIQDSRTFEPGVSSVDGLHAFSPSLGLAWKPVNDVALRANWSRSFSIPQVTELIATSVENPPFPVTDPTSSTGSTLTTILFRGNPDLEEERGKTSSLALEWTPASLAGARLSLAYSRIEIEGLISRPLNFLSSLSEILVRGNDFIPGSVTRNTDGSAIIDLAPVNASRFESKALDVEMSYRASVGAGSLFTSATATRTFDSELFTATGVSTGNRSGTINGPAHWKARGSVSWDAQAWSVTGVVNYEDGYENTNFGVVRTDVSSYTTVDAQVSREISGWLQGTRVTLGASNLFDANFPFVDNDFGFEGSRVDFRGRRVYLDVKVRF